MFDNDDALIAQLGQLRDREQQLTDNDYMTAYYKGYSSSGSTLAEVQDEMEEVQQQIRDLERQLGEDDLN